MTVVYRDASIRKVLIFESLAMAMIRPMKRPKLKLQRANPRVTLRPSMRVKPNPYIPLTEFQKENIFFEFYHKFHFFEFHPMLY